MKIDGIIVEKLRTSATTVYLIKCILNYSHKNNHKSNLNQINICLTELKGGNLHPNQDFCLKKIPLSPLNRQLLAIWKIKTKYSENITGKIKIFQNEKIIQEKLFSFKIEHEL